MSLRARLALVLAGVLVGPSVAAVLAVGYVVPRATADAEQDRVRQTARSTTSMVADLCSDVGATAQVVSARLLSVPGPLTATLAAQVTASVPPNPRVHVAVLGQGDTLLSFTGQQAPPAEVVSAKAECAAGERPQSGAPALVAVQPANGLQGRPARGRVLAWAPLDRAALNELVTRLGAPRAAEVALLGPDGRPVVVTGAEPPQAVLAAASALDATETAGDEESTAWAVEPTGNAPYTVLAWTDSGRSNALDLALGVLLASLVLSGLLIWVLAGRLSQPLRDLAGAAARIGAGDYTARTGVAGSDEIGRLGVAFDTMAADLQLTVGELRSNRDALAETFDRFGEALARTHDLRGLLETVLEASMRGGGCVVGTALLGDVGGLEERANAVAEAAPASATSALGSLAALAQEAVARRSRVLAPAVDGTGPAVAVPLQRGDRVVGALALARAPGERAFDEASLAAVGALAASAGTAVANVRAHDETRRLSVTDPLTGAGNFRQLSTTLAREVDRADRFGRPLAVLMLDLDHFKSVNDTHGHQFGDAVLREFARRLQTCLREVDTVARYGGEEFTVILPETDAEGAARVASRIVSVVHDSPFVVGSQARAVSVSVGVAAFPRHGRTSAEVMRAADAAVYAAKEGGRDRWALPPEERAGARA